ncbi:MAG: hypothetical protein NTY00_07995 [Deltaproteobacteria bacterium]|nr:hypothetical protein [Deltaproteobacteria bacterium]
MQSTYNLLTSLSTQGVFISLADNKLKIVPADKLTDEIRAQLKAHKPEIMAALSKPVSPPTNQNESIASITPPGKFLPATRGKDTKQKPSPVALEWLQDHRQQLKAAGWTMAELYRRNSSPGICWCSLWDKPFFKAYLHDNGVIEMECVIAGRDVIQTARPMPQRQMKAKESMQ